MTTVVDNPYAPPVVADDEPSLRDEAANVLAEIWALEEVKCEVRHLKSVCTHVVRWRVPGWPCGCRGPHLSCQGLRDYLKSLNPLTTLVCPEWGDVTTTAHDRLKGWVAI